MKNSKLKKLYFVLLFSAQSHLLFSQNVGINSSGAAPNPSAGLDVSFSNKGLLIPRVALTSSADISTIPSPATSLLVYNTAIISDINPGYYYFNGTSWQRLANGLGSQWANTGNNISYTSGNVGIGTSTFNSSAPEKLLVDVGTNGSINAITAKGNNSTYLQFNIQNSSSSSTASTDIVATNNIGTESSNYIDLGINSSTNNTSGTLGGPSTAYLFSTGNDFVIGNGTPSKNLTFFTTNAGGQPLKR